MDIKKYIKYVAELEKVKYTLDTSISYLNLKQSNLGIKKQYTEPQKPTEKGIFFSIIIIGYMITIFGGIGIPVGIIYGAIRWLYLGAQFGTCFKGCVFIFAEIGLIFGIILDLHPDNQKSEYYRNLNTYDRLVSEDQKRIENELILKRNLEGHEGAYNIYENEIRLNVIIIRLDDILEHLDEIRSNQFMLYNAINEGNKVANSIYQQSTKISNNIDTIAENSAATAYNSRITAINSEIIKYISLYT